MKIMATEPDYTPKPTWYRGVLFRSKGEAIFARSLDLAKIYWEYEPKRLAVGLYVPDFFCAWETKSLRLTVAIIEYKPREVTDAYLADLARVIGRHDPALVPLKLCCWGGKWQTPGCFGLKADGRWHKMPLIKEKIFQHKEEAASYRFELVPVVTTKNKVDNVPGRA